MIKISNFKGNPEFSQAIARLIIWVIMTILVWIEITGDVENLQLQNYYTFMVLYLIIALFILSTVIFIPQSSIRPYLTTPFDLGSVSYVMILSQADPFSVYYLLYPWIFVGYGSRYGRGPLFTATVVSLIGYNYILWLYNSWNTDAFSSILYTAFIIILPLYVNSMITKLKISQQQAILANKQKSDFLAAMSHEIRTPMSGIIGMISLIKNTKLDTVQSEYISSLQQSSTALHVLINDILDLSKIEAGKYQLQNRKYNLPKIIFGVTQLFTPEANTKGLELICYIQSDMPSIVEGDPDKLRQILLNLLSNAIKFTSKGEVSIQAIIINNKKDERVRIRIEVSDTGMGIPNEQLEKIFEPFYQGKNFSPKKHTGTGLGTTISHQLITLMGGEIGANSNLNKGSIFWIELPFDYCEYRNENLSLPHPDAKNILLLDDIEKSARATQNYLKSLFIHATMAQDENAVLEYLDDLSDMPDLATINNRSLLILSESHLTPDRTAFAKKLRLRYSDTIFLILITYIEKINIIKTEHADLFDTLITRPFGVFTLKHSIQTLYSNNQENTNYENTKINEPKPLYQEPKNKYTILVAEDSDINAKVITVFLEQEGHIIKRVINGADALEQLSQNKYDIVLMDMRMPILNGIDATQQWRHLSNDDPKFHELKSDIDIPIIALTANATTEDKQNCLNAGMDEFLSKPISKDELIAVIDRIITI